MQVDELRFDKGFPVEAYGPGFFRCGGDVIHGPMLVTEAAVSDWGGLQDVKALLALKGAVDVLFIGMGSEMTYLPAPLQSALDKAGIGAEAMASPTACRSFNMLLAEGRRVALAALPV